MRFALSVPPFRSPWDVLALAVDAEASGWDGVFLWDHLRWDDQVDVHDPWTLLGAFAVRTSRIRIGTMVTPLSRRRPSVVAKHLVTLDHLSGGRVVLGVGLGDPPDLDFGDFGDEPSYRTRAAGTDLDRRSRKQPTAVGARAAMGRLRPDPACRPTSTPMPARPGWSARATRMSRAGSTSCTSSHPLLPTEGRRRRGC